MRRNEAPTPDFDSVGNPYAGLHGGHNRPANAHKGRANAYKVGEDGVGKPLPRANRDTKYILFDSTRGGNDSERGRAGRRLVRGRYARLRRF